MASVNEASIVPQSPDGVSTEATSGRATPENRLVSPVDSLGDSGLILNADSGEYDDGVTQFHAPDVVSVTPDSEEDVRHSLSVTRGRAGLETEPAGTTYVSTEAVDAEPVTEPSVHRRIIVEEAMPSWFSVNQDVQRYPPTDIAHEVDGRLQIKEDALDYWGVEMTQCERTLIHHPDVLKLSDVSQMGIRFSEHGRWMTHSRLDHSIDVMEAAGRISNRLGLSRYETQLARLAGLLHDVGHIAFAHTGERIYRDITGDYSYDHDDVSVEKLKYGDLHDIIQHFDRADGSLLPDGAAPDVGIDPRHIRAILDDSPPLSDSQIRTLQKRDDLTPGEEEQLEYALLQRQYSHIRFIVKEVADRSYLRTDAMGTAFAPRVKDAIFAVYDAFEQSVRIDPQASADEFGARKVFFEDLAPVRRLLAARDALYHEYSCDIRTMLASQWLTRAVEDAIVFGDLTTEMLQELGETPILRDHLRGRYREWFFENQNEVGGCIEHYIEPVIAYQRGALTPEGVEYVFNSAEGVMSESQFMRDLKERAVQRFPELAGNIEDLLFTATEDYSKLISITFSKKGQVVPGELSRKLPDDSRYFMVSIPSDGSAGVVGSQVEEIELMALELLHQPRYIKPEYSPMTREIFQPIDKSLYVDFPETEPRVIS